MSPVEESAATASLEENLSVSGTLPYMAPEIFVPKRLMRGLTSGQPGRCCTRWRLASGHFLTSSRRW